ncbi:class I adenylate-forming enzyme family protein [Bacillus sp. 1P02SD]|uniref:class I adenylate-forming enzyme family protein n=1 Tax=Bacillus sp. 1P02SD TaxID=3132264 RepID=UPI0039A19D78
MSNLGLVLKDMYNKAFQLYGDKTAINFKDERITYKELDKQSNQLAHAFIQNGIKIETPIALLMSNCIEFAIADLAIMKIGATKIPLNHILNRNEILYMLEQSNVKAIICGPESYSIISDIREKLPFLEVIIALSNSVPKGFISMKSFIQNMPKTAPDLDVEPSNIASIQYTGGTTGVPKGIVQTQEKIALNLLCEIIELELVEQDEILLMTPLVHGAGKFLESGLLKGASHIIFEKFDPLLALNVIKQKGNIVTFMVPTMIYRLLDAIDQYQIKVSPNDIKTIAYAASPIMEERLKQGLKQFGPVFYQFYGQSECPNFITRLRKSDHSLDSDKIHRLRSCGTPSFMANVKIVDEKGKEVPKGEQGEIVVKAPYVMERYHNMPEKTNETIVNGWLHTGDIGKMDDEGYVYLLDRKNDMIVTGGLNVYSTEVENIIQKFPGIKQVAVIGVPHFDWGEQIIALVVPDPNKPPLKDDLLSYCKINLAKYKQPKEIKFVSELPLTSYGKLDKKKMREPYWRKEQRLIN